jgi:hypothetical protein
MAAILPGCSLSVYFGGEIGVGAALIVSKLFQWGKISKFQTTALANKSRPNLKLSIRAREAGLGH